MKRGQRGHILLLLMLGMTAALLTFVALQARTQGRIDARSTDDVRLQALWLARSAASAGVSGVRRVETPAGPARVEAGPGRVVVELDGATATVQVSPWVESYTP